MRNKKKKKRLQISDKDQNKFYKKKSYYFHPTIVTDNKVKSLMHKNQ